MRLVLDVEGNGLWPTKLWVVCLRNVLTGQEYVFYNPRDPLLEKLLQDADLVIGHNIFGYDLLHLKRLYDVEVPTHKVIDTMVLSKMLNVNRPEGHSLEAWGKYLSFPKGEFNDWSKVSSEMVDYCLRDCELTSKIFNFLTTHWFAKPEWKKAVECEMIQAKICADMSLLGFKFDYAGAVRLRTELDERIVTLLKEMQECFPPKEVVTVMKTKTKTEYIPFNPKSPRQIIERLNELGWKPYEKTKGHENNKDKGKKDHYLIYGWKITENNLSTLPEDAPEASRKLILYLLLTARRSTLEEWFKAYSRASGAIHGQFFSIGTWTHRKIHTNPNMGNIPTSKSIKYKSPEIVKEALDYGKRFRQLWVARPGHLLVGTDAEGIQLRVFAHYVSDHNLIDAIVKGRKEDGTDIHSLNQKALGTVCKSRDDAKTFIYAFLLGAGTAKVAQILKCSTKEAKEAVEKFLSFYPGLKRLKEEEIPRDARRGYFVGLDGRKVVVDSEHKVLAGWLQNGEAVIMKHACNRWMEELKGEKVHLVNDVHDEYVTEVWNDPALIQRVMDTQIRAIVFTGVDLEVRCPLSATSRVGENWYDVH